MHNELASSLLQNGHTRVPAFQRIIQTPCTIASRLVLKCCSCLKLALDLEYTILEPLNTVSVVRYSFMDQLQSCMADQKAEEAVTATVLLHLARIHPLAHP